jgi:type VI secretion system protein ImpD
MPAQQRDSSADAGRIEAFLAAHSPLEALIRWLDLGPDDPLPSRGVIQTRLAADIVAIDRAVTVQMNAILHDSRFQRLEASWRGLHWLVEHQGDQAAAGIQIRVLNLGWAELQRDFEKAGEFDQSQIFKKVYGEHIDQPGGEPFGLLIGDYYVRHRAMPTHPYDDVEILAKLSQLAAASFAPVIVGAQPALLGLRSFTEVERPLDCHRLFAGVEYERWNALRQAPDSRFLGVALPPILLRPPHGDHALRTDGFRYRERTCAADGSELLWGNPVWAFAAVVLRAFESSAWPADIRGVERGVEGGGLVSNLRQDSFATDAPGLIGRAPTQVILTDRMEKAFADLGLIGLCHAHGTDLCAFYSTPSLQRPAKYLDARASSNARLSSMLQHILCASRFAHYLKVMMRDRTGRFSTAEELEADLTNWIVEYTTGNDNEPPAIQRKRPLREAMVQIRETPGKSGSFQCVMHLRPHFQLDQFTGYVTLATELVGLGAA